MGATGRQEEERAPPVESAEGNSEPQQRAAGEQRPEFEQARERQGGSIPKPSTPNLKPFTLQF